MNTLPWPHEAIFAAAMIIAVVIGVVAWLRIAIFGWKTISNRREGVDLFRDAPLGNPGNILLKGELLTEKGLAYRRKMARSVVLFLATVIGGFAVAVVVAVCASLSSR